jgi:hypothetical protein
MPVSIRPHRRFPVQCLITSYGFVNRWMGGLALLMLVISGCTEWTIPPCKGTPFTTPCVGPCTMDAEPAMPNYTQVTIPLAVVIHDRYGKLHCQEIQP